MRLVLIRHAKSGWDDPLLTDHQRPLAPRGIEAAPKIGVWLAEQGIAPDEVLCSDAQRTRETWDLIAPHVGGTAPTLLPTLYHAQPSTILARVREATGQTVVVVGHNPGLCEFAGLILKSRPAHAEFGRFPTCAALIADMPVERWRDANYGLAVPMAFTVPRDL